MTILLGAPLRDWLDRHADELVAVRRHLHAHPEPSGKEHETTSFVVEQLREVGLEPRVLASGTGLVCDIGRGEGATVALRADIDALELDDEKVVPYRSRIPGVAHACGHDVHTTIVLATGIYLASNQDRLAGRVRLIFQPAEERVPGGALDVIDDRGLEGVDAIVGLHCEPKLDLGHVGFRSGAITAAADMVGIVLRGPGGHTARPELTVDMVELASRVALELPPMVDRTLEGHGPVKLVFGALQTGEASNVIPSRALLRATARTPSIDAWEELPAAVQRSVDALMAGTGAEAEIEYVHGVPPVVNDGDVTTQVREAVERELTDGSVVDAPQSWGGDDFAWYQRKAPGTYLRLGSHDPDSADRHDLHVGTFDVDERAIPVGVRVMTAAVASQLG